MDEEVLKECICKECPSYENCSEKIGYCIFDKSKCINKRKGCICTICPFAKKKKFQRLYYCITGGEK